MFSLLLVSPLSEEEKQVNCQQLFGSDENGDERISVEEVCCSMSNYLIY